MGNYVFFRMHRISDIYFVGGFGTVQWVDVGEYAATLPDKIVLDEPHKTLQVPPKSSQLKLHSKICHLWPAVRGTCHAEVALLSSCQSVTQYLHLLYEIWSM